MRQVLGALVVTACLALATGARDPVAHIERARGHLDQAQQQAQQLVNTAVEEHEQAVQREDAIREELEQTLRAHGVATEKLEEMRRQAAGEPAIESSEGGAPTIELNPYVEFSEAPELGSESVMGIMAHLDEESSFALGERAAEDWEELTRVRERLAAIIGEAQGVVADAQSAVTSADLEHIAKSEALSKAFERSSEAYRLLQRAVVLRRDIEKIRAALQHAIGLESKSVELVPFEACEAELAAEEKRVGEMHEDVEVHMQDRCEELVHRLVNETEHMELIEAEERAELEKSVCRGVRILYALRVHTDSARRACNRIRIAVGSASLMGRHRLYLAHYTCSPDAPANATCSGRGTCTQNETCVCESGWHASDCSMRSCPSDCSGNGFCDQGKCRCLAGYVGEGCETKSCPVVKGRACAGNGVCEPDSATRALTCMCSPGFKGEACDEPVCPFGEQYRFECSARGTCSKHGACRCFRGYGGDACETRVVQHGVCNAQGGCLCDEGWTGAACDLLECPHMCSGANGICDGRTGKCKCAPGFRGTGCQYVAPECPAAGEAGECSGRGLCAPVVEGERDGKCVCPYGWTGEACEIEACPAACEASRRGVCVNNTCRCFTGYSGEACAVQKKVPAKCGQECFEDCLHTAKCTVSRLEGEHNVNKDLYTSERSEDEQRVIDRILLTSLPATADAGSGKMVGCFVACAQQCSVERCWTRGAEMELPDELLA